MIGCIYSSLQPLYAEMYGRCARPTPRSPAQGKCGSGRVSEFIMERMW